MGDAVLRAALWGLVAGRLLAGLDPNAVSVIGIGRPQWRPTEWCRWRGLDDVAAPWKWGHRAMVSETHANGSRERTQRTVALDQSALLEVLDALKVRRSMTATMPPACRGCASTTFVTQWSRSGAPRGARRRRSRPGPATLGQLRPRGLRPPVPRVGRSAPGSSGCAVPEADGAG